MKPSAALQFPADFEEGQLFQEKQLFSCATSKYQSGIWLVSPLSPDLECLGLLNRRP